MFEATENKNLGWHAKEVKEGERFEFGKNWARFLTLLNDERIVTAENSLKRMLEVDNLKGKSFLDIGSGSGLFSLAARRLGAKVHSFDYDPNSVACTAELKRRYFPNDSDWKVEEGSVLDPDYIRSLGLFDVVYSWGVLHHTGQMWLALDHAQSRVAPGKKLFIAIYNNTGTQAARWKTIKKIYNTLPSFLRLPFAIAAVTPSEIRGLAGAIVRGSLGKHIRARFEVKPERGMNHWHDIIDWVGGYPYEVATPDEIFDFHRDRGFTLTKIGCGLVGLGCNEFVFVKQPLTQDGWGAEKP